MTVKKGYNKIKKSSGLDISLEKTDITGNIAEESTIFCTEEHRQFKCHKCDMWPTLR
jgi:hypothetical protein